ncbi:hypothetical protein FHX81_7766 [Saccharothrix saharensis]|uniref:Uncharacterized protein n=1 Tax=Saccharothrix saharensis TaxID=571190 RepID=A0A543JR57_9PSEU|nr:hypothetical protein [Saccharothrix saharensis]TQM85287.1 hypothetical protein FHX81_7766 [Saccharothrix saharensis]
MGSLLSKGLVVGAAFALAGAFVPMSAYAASAPRDFGACMTIATDHDAEAWIAHDACDSDSLTGCYRIFYQEYGRQQWALEACQARGE